MSDELADWLRTPLARRSVTVPVVAMGSAILGATAGVWAPVTAALDLGTSGRRRFSRLRLLSFAWAWTTLETVGVGAAAGLWLAGRADDRDAHYALQRWWAGRLVDSLRWFANLRIEVEGARHLAPGPLVLCARHASIVDSLLPAWLLGHAGMQPRYVLKTELLMDPCLDVVGNRLPNHFVDRNPDASRTELDHLERLARGMGALDAAVIFPEGMVVTEAGRMRAIERVVAQGGDRATRVRRLGMLAPVRAGGTAALLAGAPDADVVFMTHTGLEMLQGIGDAAANVPLGAPVRVRLRRVRRAEVPSGDAFLAWLDGQWEIADRELGRLASRCSGTF